MHHTVVNVAGYMGEIKVNSGLKSNAEMTLRFQEIADEACVGFVTLNFWWVLCAAADPEEANLPMIGDDFSISNDCCGILCSENGGTAISAPHADTSKVNCHISLIPPASPTDALCDYLCSLCCRLNKAAPAWQSVIWILF